MKASSGRLPPMRSVKVLERLRERPRYQHYSLRKEQIYVYWIVKSVCLHDQRLGARPAALAPKPWSDAGRKPRLLRRDADHQPVSVKALAMGLPDSDYRLVSWRAGINGDLSSRFASIRVRAAHRDHWRAELRDEEWLLIEWPEGQSEPEKYVLYTLPADISLERLVAVTKMRWRIERDYQDLKQEFGLAHYEGRGRRGFHHHATLCITAYGFLVAERLRHKDTKKTPYSARNLPYPKVTCRRAARRAPRHVPNSISMLRWIIAQTLASRRQRSPCCAKENQEIDRLF